MSSVEKLMDGLDECRRELLGLSGKEIDAVFEEMPVFVACGAQSSGKSAIVSRLSGFQLPQSSQLCTRVVTEIELRRSSEVLCQVYATGGGKPQTVTMEELPDAVKELQNTLVSQATSAFILDKRIVIRLQGPDKLNVTLVDLPGLHSDTDNGKQDVNKLTLDNINRAGALALHIVKGDQDYGSILGADVINDNETLNRLTVLTHCDRIAGDVADRLKPTLQRTQKVSLHTIAVSGLEEYDDDVQKRVENVDARLEVGIQSLKDAVETCMQNKVQEQLPKVLLTLEKNLEEAKKLLETLARVPEFKVVQNVFTILSDSFATVTANYEKRSLRERSEQLALDLSYFLNPRDNNDQFSRERVIPRIQEFQRDRGTRNVSFSDRHAVLVSYAREFAEFYGEVIRRHLDDLLNCIIRGMSAEVWNNTVHSAGTKIPKVMKDDVTEIFDGLRAEVDKHVSALVHGNTDPLAVYTTDESRLVQLVKESESADDNHKANGSWGQKPPATRHSSQAAPHTLRGVDHNSGFKVEELELYHMVKAFLDIQTQFVTEAACKMLVYFYATLKNAFDKVTRDDIDKYIQLVRQPSEAKRNAAQITVDAFSSVLPKIKALSRL